MKKLFVSFLFCSLFIVTKTFAQSNLTWTLKYKAEKGFFKTNTAFNSSFSGFNNKAESASFIEKIKSNPDVASVNVSNMAPNGNCDVMLNMKQPHDRMYYISLAQKLGIIYLQANNGPKKTVSQVLTEIRNKKK
jgi:hypothetical protein